MSLQRWQHKRGNISNPYEILCEIPEKSTVEWREGGRLLDVAAASQPGGAGGGDG